jgi:hypothetical protein
MASPPSHHDQGAVRKLAQAREVRDHGRMNERRQRRSDNPSEAMQLLLEAHRDRLDVRTLVVMDGDGRVLASAGDAPSAVASAIAGEAAEAGEAPDAALATWQLQAGGDQVTIGSLGGKLSCELGDGVRRILG